MVAILGIDISKTKFDVVLLEASKQRDQEFANTEAGFGKQQVRDLQAGMEVTGVYGDNLAT